MRGLSPRRARASCRSPLSTVARRKSDPFGSARRRRPGRPSARASSSTRPATSSPTTTSCRARRRSRSASPQRSSQRDRRRRRPLQRHRRAARRRAARARAAAARRLRQRAGSVTRSSRSATRSGSTRTVTSGIVSAPAPDPGAQRLHDRTRDPDRRRAEPRQLGRPAARRGRPGDRRQLADPTGDGATAASASASRADRHGKDRRLPDHPHRQGRARLPRPRPRRSTPELARFFNLPHQHGLLVESVGRRQPRRDGRLRAGSTAVVVAGETYMLGGDIVVAADGAPVDRRRPPLGRRSTRSSRATGSPWGSTGRGKKETIDVKLGAPSVLAN